MKTRPITFNREDVLTEALRLSVSVGYNKVTREMLAFAANCSPAQISNMFGTMAHLRRAIVSAAVHREDLAVLAQALAHNEAKANAANPDLKRRALEALL